MRPLYVIRRQPPFRIVNKQPAIFYIQLLDRFSCLFLLIFTLILFYFIANWSQLSSIYANWQNISIPKRQSSVEKHLNWVVDNRRVVPPFRKFESRFRISPKHKINVCVIEKNMSTILTAIICYLFDSKQFNTEIFDKRLCKGKSELPEFIGDLKNYTNVGEWLHLAVSRDPIERFVSGFVDKCVIKKIYTQRRRKGTCQNCKSNATCFIERMHRRMLRYSNEVKVHKYKSDEIHFNPQNWRCNFSKHFGDYKIISFNNSRQFLHKLFSVLKKHGVDQEDINLLKNQLKIGRTGHTPTGRVERRKLARFVRESPYLLKKLVEMYYYDFVLFGYEIPKINGF